MENAIGHVHLTEYTPEHAMWCLVARRFLTVAQPWGEALYLTQYLARGKYLLQRLRDVHRTVCLG